MPDLSFYCKADGRTYTLFQRFAAGPYYFRKQHGGKNIMRSVGKDLPAAKAEAKRQIAELVAGDAIIDREATFEDLLERFVATRQTHAKHTQENDKWKLKTFRETCPKTQAELQGKMGLALNTPARNVRSGDVLAWLNETAKAKSWKARTLNHFRLFLLQAFTLGVADRLLTRDENPFASKLIKRKRHDHVKRFIPTPEQFKALIDNVREHNGEEYADYLEFLGLAGLGEAEVLPMLARDVEKDHLKVVRVKTTVPFDVPIYPWLRALVDKRVARTFTKEQPLFQVNDADKRLLKACRRLGYTYRNDKGKLTSKFTPRSLRAMLIKRLHVAGVPVKRIALWQGHRDGGRLIMEVYTEVFCDTDAAAERADLARLAA